MQSLAGQKIEFRAGHAGHRRRHARAKGFLHGPEGLRFIRRSDDDDPGRIETETIQAMSVQAVLNGALVRKGDKNHRTARRQAAEQGGDEAEGGGPVCPGHRRDLMYGGQRQAALRQAGIQRRQAEGQDPVCGGDAALPEHQTPQFMHDFGSFSAVLGKG